MMIRILSLLILATAGNLLAQDPGQSPEDAVRRALERVVVEPSPSQDSSRNPIRVVQDDGQPPEGPAVEEPVAGEAPSAGPDDGTLPEGSLGTSSAGESAGSSGASPGQSAGPSAPVTDGAINVLTDPAGADVILDGRIVGVTPLFRRGLAPGEHDLELVRAGGTILKRRVRIAAGKVLNMKLPGASGAGGAAAGPRSFGRVILESVPPGANVALPGGVSLGRTPLTTEIPAGLHFLTFSAPDHDEQQVPVRAMPGRDERVVVKLESNMSLIDVFRQRRRRREVSLYMGSAKRLMENGRLREALDKTLQAVAADPDSPVPYELQAELYEALGDRTAAADAADKAASLRQR